MKSPLALASWIGIMYGILHESGRMRHAEIPIAVLMPDKGVCEVNGPSKMFGALGGNEVPNEGPSSFEGHKPYRGELI